MSTRFYIFGDSIAAINQMEAGADVVFESGRRETYDLVIGADGQHSNVRAKVFGPECEFVKKLDFEPSGVAFDAAFADK